MTKSRKSPVFSIFILASILAGCAGLTQSNKPATKTWWLKPYVDVKSESVQVPASLLTVSVKVVPGLDSERILTLSYDSELSQFTAARWTDNLPEMVTSLVSRTLEESGRFEMLPDQAGGKPDSCKLQLEVREFFAELNSSEQVTGVRVAMSGGYYCKTSGSVMLEMGASVKVHDERMSVIVAAFQQALDEVMKEMLRKL